MGCNGGRERSFLKWKIVRAHLLIRNVIQTESMELTKQMELRNAYSAPTIVSTMRTSATGVRRFYLPCHFFCFILSYLVCTFLFFCLFAGPTETIASFIDQTHSWLIASALGTAVWFVHACVATLNASVRRTGPILNAIVGAVGFIACVLASQFLGDYGPNSIAIPLSWTPEYILISTYIGGSISAVAILAWATRTPMTDGEPSDASASPNRAF
ncbi:hypothetical protein Poly59_36250 [Rubripirellula reticaptiva]|uniref:Uncharacterized protein n=1 Tax=Rubripirellula reticaptiva TaxID=2528013 RepID=A0A5C6ESP6_9BACT|nr:hypothetical protein Poly59_36250 [Rubripirellula reticaptiva]